MVKQNIQEIFAYTIKVGFRQVPFDVRIANLLDIQVVPYREVANAMLVTMKPDMSNDYLSSMIRGRNIDQPLLSVSGTSEAWRMQDFDRGYGIDVPDLAREFYNVDMDNVSIDEPSFSDLVSVTNYTNTLSKSLANLNLMDGNASTMNLKFKSDIFSLVQRFRKDVVSYWIKGETGHANGMFVLPNVDVLSSKGGFNDIDKVVKLAGDIAKFVIEKGVEITDLVVPIEDLQTLNKYVKSGNIVNTNVKLADVLKDQLNFLIPNSTASELKIWSLNNNVKPTYPTGTTKRWLGINTANKPLKVYLGTGNTGSALHASYPIRKNIGVSLPYRARHTGVGCSDPQSVVYIDVA